MTLAEKCGELAREVNNTQAENKQLAGHISRVLGLVTSFTQAQASSNNEVRSVLTAQVLALTEHVSALTKQFTLMQLDQRQARLDATSHQQRGLLAPDGAAALEKCLCDDYIRLCDSVKVSPAGTVLCSLTSGARSIRLQVRPTPPRIFGVCSHMPRALT